MFFDLGSVHHDKVEYSRWQNGVSKYQWLGPEPNQIAWALTTTCGLLIILPLYCLCIPSATLSAVLCHNCTI